MNRIRKLSLALLLGLMGCGEGDKSQAGMFAKSNNAFDKIKLSDLNEQPINLDQYKGKIIFINFWATWCKPCIAEMPSIERAGKILQNNNVVFLLASNEEVSAIKDFMNANDYKLKFIRVENMEELNIQALPTSFIFNREGALVFSETGYRRWDDKHNIDTILKIAN